MNFLSLIFVSIGLAIDSFAASICCGTKNESHKIFNLLKISFIFAVFQGMLTLIGWLTGSGLKNFITGIDHWIAFLILGFIGIKMMSESKNCPKEKEINLKNSTIILLALATSIDALAVGITFAFLDISITKSALTIGFTTLVFSIVGILAGKKISCLFEQKIHALGGIVLIVIGTKILISHLTG